MGRKGMGREREFYLNYYLPTGTFFISLGLQTTQNDCPQSAFIVLLVFERHQNTI